MKKILLIVFLLVPIFLYMNMDGSLCCNENGTAIHDSYKGMSVPVMDASRVKVYGRMPDRMIAHAGGSVNGMIYTNSLEALNENYHKGARYFELDLRLTSDDKLVAVHEWGEWAKKSDYAGSLPPTYGEFISTRVNGLTPLDVQGIVKWFELHPDSYLVTDKIDDPILVRASFPFYNDRVLMEVFSWEHYQVAKELGIWGVMINGNLLLSDDYIRDVKLNGVKFAAFSRRLLPAHLGRIEKLGEIGVKVYLYHAQEDGYTDVSTISAYVPKAYGIYFDYWVNQNDQGAGH